MFQFLVCLYVTLPFCAALLLKERVSVLWRLLYALPMMVALVALLGLFMLPFHQSLVQGLLVVSILLAWGIRPLAGKCVFGQMHLSHFFVHGLISLFLLVGLFFF
ncbi:hypothetical protein ABPH35_10780 [Streptococcus sp. ZJ93]|uniref:hypothetical protein n=1 Tax=Streptococcus handemini TaxID=3161188 RepID=UPI0032EBA7C4